MRESPHRPPASIGGFRDLICGAGTSFPMAVSQRQRPVGTFVVPGCLALRCAGVLSISDKISLKMLSLTCAT